jgi:hypothetical protein
MRGFGLSAIFSAMFGHFGAMGSNVQPMQERPQRGASKGSPGEKYYCRYYRDPRKGAVNPRRRAMREACKELGITGKQYRRAERKSRRLARQG